MAFVSAQDLQRAVAIYMHLAYPGGRVGAAVQEKLALVDKLTPDSPVPESWFELSRCDNERRVYALRLGQPIYPHMKLVLEESPDGSFLFRADAHDNHLHAPPGSPDEKPLAALRAANKTLTDAIEAAWVQAGLPTFKQYLRAQLEARKSSHTPHPSNG